jgi:hypothetical protein
MSEVAPQLGRLFRISSRVLGRTSNGVQSECAPLFFEYVGLSSPIRGGLKDRPTIKPHSLPTMPLSDEINVAQAARLCFELQGSRSGDRRSQESSTDIPVCGVEKTQARPVQSLSKYACATLIQGFI